MTLAAAAAYDELELEFIPPFDWTRMLRFFSGRATGGVEAVHEQVYYRTVSVDDATGLLSVRRDPQRDVLIVRVEGEARHHLDRMTPRLVRLFDLKTHPDAVRQGLTQDPWLASLLDNAPGLRVPGAWSGFELVVRTIVGQQVSVKAATTIVGRLVQRAGTAATEPSHPLTPWHFPTPHALAQVNLDKIGMPGKRVATLQRFAQAVADGEVDIDNDEPDIATLRRQLLDMPGIGPWTVEYAAMRAWRDADAWPATDLVLMQAIARRMPELTRKSDQLKHAQSWKPWRAYVAMHLWNEIADQMGLARGG